LTAVQLAAAGTRYIAGAIPSTAPTFSGEYMPFSNITRETVLANDGLQRVVFYQERYQAPRTHLLFVVGSGATGKLVKRMWIQPHQEIKRTGAFKYPRAGYQV